LKRYIDHLDDIEDPKALNIIRKNLEAKQDEIEWYDQQATKERSQKLDTKIETTQEKAKELVTEAKDGKKGGGLPFPLIVVAGAIGAAAFFLLRRGEDSDYDDYGEDAFTYESEGEGATASNADSLGTYSSPGNGATTSNY